MTVGRRGALLFLLIVTFASEYAYAQRLVCSPIRVGETAASVATRITGDARNRHAAWFQIVYPARRRAIPKGRYDHVQTGWRACIVDKRGQTVPSGLHPLRASFVGFADTGASVVSGMLSRVDSTYALWGLLILIIAFAGWGIHDYLSNRQAILRLMKSFGETFVQEFDRPLVRSRPSDRVIDSQFRFCPHRARVDVLLAPRDGRSYPNLSDHKQNVEYDVSRVLQAMKKTPFVHGPLYAQGRWVVVPFQFSVNSEQAGVK